MLISRDIMHSCTRIPLCAKKGVGDIETLKLEYIYIAKQLEEFTNTMLSKDGHMFQAKLLSADDRLCYVYIIPKIVMPKKITLSAFLATFCDNLHMKTGCPFNNVHIDWVQLPNNNCTCGTRVRATDQLTNLQKISARDQFVLSSADSLHNVIRGPKYRISNLVSGTVLKFGGQLISYWKNMCNEECSDQKLCDKHENLLHHWMDTTCPCYRHIWTRLFMQESQKTLSTDARALVTTLDNACTVIDNSELIENYTTCSDYLPAVREGKLVTSDTAIRVMLEKFEDARKKKKRAAIIMNGPMGSGKSYAWRNFIYAQVVYDFQNHSDESFTVLVVLPRISLCKDVAKTLGKLLNGTIDVTAYDDEQYVYGDRVIHVTVVNSLVKVGVIYADVVIIDELETVISNLWGSLMDRGEGDEVFGLLTRLMDRSLLTICMDGTMSRRVISLPTDRDRNREKIKLRLRPRRTQRQTLVLCKAMSPIFLRAQENPHQDDFFNILCTVAARPSNRIAVCLGSLKTAYNIRAVLRYNTHKAILVVSDKEEGQLHEQFAKCSQYDVVIFTPSVAVGLSESESIYTHVFAYVELAPHTMTLEHYIQMLARVRRVQRPETYVAFARPYSYGVMMPDISLYGELCRIQMGKLSLSRIWQQSAAHATRDFIKMWKQSYYAWSSEMNEELSPCVVEYTRSELQFDTDKIIRPEKLDRAKARSFLRSRKVSQKLHMTKEEIDLLCKGGCFSAERAREISEAVFDMYIHVKEDRTQKIFFRHLIGNRQ